MTKRPSTITIKKRALIARVRRALAKQGRDLRTDRRERQVRYMLIDLKRGTIVDANVDVEALARELGCMERWESGGWATDRKNDR